MTTPSLSTRPLSTGETQARDISTRGDMEKFWTKCRPGEEKMKMLLAEQLRSAVPNEHSIDNKAKKIAQILNSEERVNVNWKTVRNWLNEIHLPHMRYLPALAALIGTEFVFRFIFGGDDS